jgi:hypothetical protein
VERVNFGLGKLTELLLNSVFILEGEGPGFVPLICYQMMAAEAVRVTVTRYVIVINWIVPRPLVVGPVVTISEYFGQRIFKSYWSSARNVQVRQTIQIKRPRSVKLMFLV